MKDEKLFVKGLYEKPEVRSIAPGHLVRCGHSSVYDVNFGKEAGASAIILLMQGLSGVTVVAVHHGRIQYLKTEEAIAQRQVDLTMIAFYEHLGICFGRQPQDADINIEEKSGVIERFM